MMTPLQWTPLLSVVRESPKIDMPQDTSQGIFVYDFTTEPTNQELCPLKTLPATLLSGNFYG